MKALKSYIINKEDKFDNNKKQTPFLLKKEKKKN